MTTRTGATRDGEHGPSFRRRIRGLVLLLGLTMFLTVGCIRYELGIVVNADGSGSLNVLAAIADEFAQMADMSADDLLDANGVIPNASVAAYNEDGFTGMTMTVAFASIEEMQALLEWTDTESIASNLDVEPDGDGGWRFSATLDPASDAPGGAQPPAALLDGAWARVRVEMPGAIAEHNADRIDAGAFVWDLDFTSRGPREMTAQTTGSAGGPVTSIAIIAIIATLSVVAAGAIIGRRRTRR